MRKFKDQYNELKESKGELPKFNRLPHKNAKEEALRRIGIMCEHKKCTFLGFCDKEGNDSDWKNVNITYLKLKCNVCQNEWHSTSYTEFISKITNCPQCYQNSKFLSLEIALENIQEKCIEKNYTFNGFCNKEGKDCEWYDTKTYLKLKCNNCGNEWNTTKYNSLINIGKGCPKCKQSKLENIVQKMLEEESIEFEHNKFYDFIGGLQLDFYIPSKRIAIECQGIQHFEPIPCFGGDEKYLWTVRNDKKKASLCEANSIKLLYYSNLGKDYPYPYKVFIDKEELLKEISTHCN